MKIGTIMTAALVVLAAGCASRKHFVGDSDRMADLTIIDTTRTVTRANAEDILRSYMMEFSIPNPLVAAGGGVTSAANDPSHESTITCRAVLFDDHSTEADIYFNCPADSLDDGCAAFRAAYMEQRVREGMFRIMIAMESGFSDKSMEPDLWTFYLETPGGVMLEPSDTVATPVMAVDDSIYSEYYRRSVGRQVNTRNITFYFPQETFFGEDLLTGDTPYLVFVISRDRRTIARLAWKLRNPED